MAKSNKTGNKNRKSSSSRAKSTNKKDKKVKGSKIIAKKSGARRC
jgi:hypothetical protein